MKKNLLYYRVQNKLINTVLESGKILHHSKLIDECICMTRDPSYLSKSRPFVIVFDRDVLRTNYKISPFCLFGYESLRNSDTFKRWSKTYNFGFESEERVYANYIPLEKAEFVGRYEDFVYNGSNR